MTDDEGMAYMVTFAHKVLTYDLKWKGFDYAKMEADLNEFGIIVKRARG